MDVRRISPGFFIPHRNRKDHHVDLYCMLFRPDFTSMSRGGRSRSAWIRQQDVKSLYKKKKNPGEKVVFELEKVEWEFIVEQQELWERFSVGKGLQSFLLFLDF